MLEFVLRKEVKPGSFSRCEAVSRMSSARGLVICISLIDTTPLNAHDMRYY
jgi:hypothetical protein